MRISVISFNTLGAPLTPPTFKKAWNIRKRFLAFAKELDKKNASIIALQEVITYAHLRMLKKNLKNYPFVTYQKHLMGPKGGLVTFSKTPLEKITYVSFKKLGQYRNRTFIYKVLRNGMLICKIPNTAVCVLNTHTLANFDHDWTEKNKYMKVLSHQLHEIGETVKRLSKVFQTVIVAGDFNVDKHSVYYRTLAKHMEAVNIFERYARPTLQKELMGKKRTPKIIDYIFLKSQEAVSEILNAQYLFTKKHRYPNGRYGYLSDHVALHAEIALKG